MLFFSCKEDLTQQPENQSTIQEAVAIDTDGQTELGKKLENPYAVTNMRKAYGSLLKKKKAGKKQYLGKVFTDETEIETTDYYVKFLVKNEVQKSLLIADSLNLSEIPLDVEIETEGDYYVNQEALNNEEVWLYTSVPKDYNFHPEIPYEILEELFLFEEPETEEETLPIYGKGNISTSFLLDLEEEALRITNNLETPEKETELAGRRRRKPYGWIRVMNTVTGKPEGVEGVKVVTRRWFKWGSAYTTSNGYYKINKKYKRDVRYTIRFNNKSGFKIWQSLVNVRFATYGLGKNSSKGKSYTFDTNSVGWAWSTVNNATVQYFKYCEQFNIGKPHDNLRIVASRGTGASSAPMLRRTLDHISLVQASQFLSHYLSGGIAKYFWIALRFVIPDVIIRAAPSKGTQTVYSIVFHELAHASHYKQVGNSYWGRFIDYIIFNGAYGDGKGSNAGVCGVGEMWGNYFSAVCMDRKFPNRRGISFHLNETREWFNPGFMLDVKNTTNITTTEIFNCLTKEVDSFNKLISKLKTKTEQDEKIDAAFANYTDWP